MPNLLVCFLDFYNSVINYTYDFLYEDVPFYEPVISEGNFDGIHLSLTQGESNTQLGLTVKLVRNSEFLAREADSLKRIYLLKDFFNVLNNFNFGVDTNNVFREMASSLETGTRLDKEVIKAGEEACNSALKNEVDRMKVELATSLGACEGGKINENKIKEMFSEEVTKVLEMSEREDKVDELKLVEGNKELLTALKADVEIYYEDGCLVEEGKRLLGLLKGWCALSREHLEVWESVSEGVEEEVAPVVVQVEEVDTSTSESSVKSSIYSESETITRADKIKSELKGLDYETSEKELEAKGKGIDFEEARGVIEAKKNKEMALSNVKYNYDKNVFEKTPCYKEMTVKEFIGIKNVFKKIFYNIFFK